MGQENILHVPRKIQYAASVNVPPVIRDCSPGLDIPKAVAKYAPKKYKIVPREPVFGEYLTLEMEIVEVLTNGFVVRGVLRDQDKEKRGSFTVWKEAFRFGACRTVKGAAKAIGKDVGQWLISPSMNARLGR